MNHRTPKGQLRRLGLDNYDCGRIYFPGRYRILYGPTPHATYDIYKVDLVNQPLPKVGFPFSLLLDEEPDATAPAERPVDGQPITERPADEPQLRYAGKTFEEWRQVVVTDLDPQSRAKAMEAFGVFEGHGYRAEEAVAAIAEGLKQTNNKDVVEAACRSLAQTGPGGTPVLIELLQHEHAYIRVLAAEWLARYPSPERAEATMPALPLLLAAIRDEDESPYVREHACSAIGNVLGECPTEDAVRKAVPALIEVAQTQRLWNGRPFFRDQLAAIRALGRIGPAAKEALPLIRALAAEQGNSFFGREAARALQQIEPDPAAPRSGGPSGPARTAPRSRGARQSS